jgi:heat shock protein HslJ
MIKATTRTIAVAVLVSVLGNVLPAAADENDLLGTAWLAQEIAGNASAEAVRSTLEFAKPGQAGGTTGCNQFFGPVSLGGGGMVFGNLASTRKMCPPAEMDQEQRFLQALSTARRLELAADGQSLLIYADDSEPVLRFTRIVDK